MRQRMIGPGMGVLLGAAAVLAAAPAAAEDKPNILFIVSDDTGYGDRGPYGDGQGTWAPYLYQTWLYEKLTTCLVPLLMLLLSAALAQQIQRAGRLELLFLGGAAIGFAFFVFNGITLAMGEVGLLPPLLASLAPLVAFTAVAGSVIYWNELKKRPT